MSRALGSRLSWTIRVLGCLLAVALAASTTPAYGYDNASIDARAAAGTAPVVAPGVERNVPDTHDSEAMLGRVRVADLAAATSSLNYDDTPNPAPAAVWDDGRSSALERHVGDASGPSLASSDELQAPQVLTPAQRGRYLFDNWHRATFDNRLQSINYHLRVHGNGRTAFEYTRDAQNFFARNRDLATQVTLRDGTAGLHIQTKVPLPGGGTTNVGGYWTSDGRLVTFWD